MDKDKRPGSIFAVVVTYNRKELLKACLDALLRQTVDVEKILIIDNASSDGTQEMLRDLGYLANPKFDYHRLHENTGGAGGFHYGIEQAMSDSPEWIWLMDDDIAPESEALEILLSFKTVSSCIHPRKRYSNGDYYLWEGYIDPLTGKRVELYDWSFKQGKDICFVNTMCFEGVLIKSSVIGLAGLPDPKYFIVYDDTVYGLEVNKYTNIAYVRDAIFEKKINKESEPPSEFFIYYSMRNYFYRQKAVANIYGTGMPIKYLVIVLVFISYAIRIFLKGRSRLACYKALGKGFVDGIRGVRGRSH